MKNKKVVDYESWNLGLKLQKDKFQNSRLKDEEKVLIYESPELGLELPDEWRLFYESSNPVLLATAYLSFSLRVFFFCNKFKLKKVNKCAEGSTVGI